MKWLLIGFVLGWAVMSAIIGCSQEPEKSNYSTSQDRKSELLRLDVSVIEVHGCEYIVFYRASGGCIIHKQNCQFCKDREANKFLREQIGKGK